MRQKCGGKIDDQGTVTRPALVVSFQSGDNGRPMSFIKKHRYKAHLLPYVLG